MTIDSLLQVIRTERPLKALHAIRELGELKAPQAAEILIEVLFTGNALTQHAAAEALAAYDEDRVTAALCKALKHAPDLVRLQIVKTLEKLNQPETVPCLMGALQEATAESLQYTIIEALGNMKAVQARDLIRLYLTHSHHHICKRAQTALNKLDNV